MKNFIKKKPKQIFINRAFKEVTTCQKVTKFTDIFWKLAVYRLMRIKFRNVTVKGNKELKIFNKFVNNN